MNKERTKILAKHNGILFLFAIFRGLKVSGCPEEFQADVESFFGSGLREVGGTCITEEF